MVRRHFTDRYVKRVARSGKPPDLPERYAAGGEYRVGDLVSETQVAVAEPAVSERAVSERASRSRPTSPSHTPGSVGLRSPSHNLFTPGLLTDLQQSAGNQAVARLVQRDPSGAPAAPAAAPATGPGTTPATAGAAVNVSIGIKSEEPAKTYTKSAEIAIQHGRHDVVAWTTPNWETTTFYVQPNDVRLGFRLMFAVDLPADYDKERQAIVESHEMGHVEIAKRKAEEILKVGLPARIRALPTIDEASVTELVRTAFGELAAAEKAGAKAYDDRDYPLMMERYKGRKLSLAQLKASSPAIGAAVAAIRQVPRIGQLINRFDTDSADQIIERVKTSRGALDGAALARTQYNQEFQAVVAGANSSATELYRSLTLLPGIGEGRNEDYAPKLVDLIQALNSFAFSAGTASAGI